MTALDSILLARADEQVRRALQTPERVCEWPEHPCTTPVAYWSKSGLCKMHGSRLRKRLEKWRSRL